MDSLDDNLLIERQNVLTTDSLKNLGSSRPWMVVVGILFIIGGLFSLIYGISALFSPTPTEFKAMGMDKINMWTSVWTIAFSIVFVFAGYLAVMMGGDLRTLAKGPSAAVFEQYTKRHKLFWLLMGLYGVITPLFFLIIVIVYRKVFVLAAKYMAG